MAITYVNAASAASDTVNLPSGWNQGDVAVVVAYNSSSGTIPSVPSEWISERSATNASGASILGYRVLQTGDTSIGTWTNATQVGVAIWSGVDRNTPFDYKMGISPFIPLNPNTGSSWTQLSDLRGYSSSVHVAEVLLSTSTVSSFTGTGWTNRNGTGTRFGVADLSGTYSSSTFGFTSNLFTSADFALRSAGSVYPQIADQDTTSGTVTSNSTSWTLTYPTNIAANDLLILLLAKDGSGNGNVSATGWTRQTQRGSAVELASFGRIADGSETGTFTVSVGSTAEQGAWLIYRILAETWYQGTTLSDNTVGADYNGLSLNASLTGSPDSNPDPASLDPANWGAENTLWMVATAVDTSRDITAYPSSPDTFTNTGKLVSGGSNGASLGWARLEKNASSVDPGTFTIASSDDWSVVTIAIRPKQIIQQFAQAQVQISTSGATTRNAWSQAQSDIKATSQKWSQAQTDIKTTSNTWAQAQSDIKQIYQAWAQGNAKIKSTVSSFAQAQTNIKATISSFAQSQSNIKAISNSYSQAQADIKQTYSIFAQANSSIIKTIQVYSQAQSDIKAISTGFAQAQSHIRATLFQAAQSNAFIMCRIAYDDFTRTLDPGWGQSTDTNVDWGVNTFAGSLIDNISVDGTTGLISSYDTHIIGYPYVSDGMVQFDVQLHTASNPRIYFDTRTDRLALEVFGLNDVEFSNFFGDIIFLSGLSDGDWITVKAIVHVIDGQTTYIKAWKRGTAEPAWTISQASDASSTFGSAGADILVQPNNIGYSVHIDNLSIWTFGTVIYLKYAQAGASIKATDNAFAQSQTNIKATSNAFAQTEAQISATITVPQFAQAQSGINTTYVVNVQAQSDINQTYNGFAQTQAAIATKVSVFAQVETSIKATVSQFAQANVDIKSTLNTFAQVQSDIKTTYDQFAQSQAQIKTTYNTFAQAQALIQGRVFAQAQAGILQIYDVFAQVQGSIVGGVSQFVQAQATIKATNTQSAQAQGYIKVTDIETFAQANANIKTAYSEFAQVNAYILVTNNNVSAQAQAQIKQTYQEFAQTNASIAASITTYAQAQAYIYIPVYARPIADVSNNGWVRVVI